MPVSGWYVKASLVGLFLLIIAIPVGYFVPIGENDEDVLCLLAVHLVDETGKPVEGAIIGAKSSSDLWLPMCDVFGTTNKSGLAFGGTLSYDHRKKYLLSSPRGQEPSTDFLLIVDANGKRWFPGWTAKGFPVPMEEPYVSAKFRKWESLPAWASDVEILHATVDW